MRKTKFIKVSVDDKLPDTFGHYVTFNIHNQKGYHYFDDGEKQFWSDDEIHEWLEEVPDREEEMTDMLEECKNQLEYLNGKFPTGTTSNILSRLQQLLHRILKMN